jgi:hypothetical protein
VAELVDALVSGISGESRGGSSPLLGTINSMVFRNAVVKNYPGLKIIQLEGTAYELDLATGS